LYFISTFVALKQKSHYPIYLVLYLS